jgi:hypothetical protein
MIHAQIIPLGAGPPGTTYDTVHSSVGERVVSAMIGSHDAPVMALPGEGRGYFIEKLIHKFSVALPPRPSQPARGLGQISTDPNRLRGNHHAGLSVQIISATSLT